jgi:Ca2+-transporting ATPase
MASGFQANGEVNHFVKGDPSVILNMCHEYLTDSGEVKSLDLNFLQFMSVHIAEIAQNGGTALGIAYAMNPTDRPPGAYTFICLFYLDNSLQPRVGEIVRQVTLNAKRSMLLTGDRDETAARIAVQCGISNNENSYLSGRTIARMATLEVARQCAYCSVFSRLLPSQKGLIIRLLQQSNHLVAMVGDGPNDGIALKVADVSISFTTNSSPIARRLSKILVNELGDILKLIDASKRIKVEAEDVHTMRGLLSAMAFLGAYAWMFISLFLK